MRLPPFISTNLRRTVASSMASRAPLVISPAEYKKLPQATTVPIDVSWHMPTTDRSALAEYLSGPRLPGARRFDLDEIAELDPGKNPLSLAHMLPSAQRFEEACQNLGISDDTHVVCYDSTGVFSSPRGVYTFKAFGHAKVSALDGGLPRWIAEGGEVEVGDVPDVGESEYLGAKGPEPSFVKSYQQIIENIEKGPGDDGHELVLEHRSFGRYEGSAPEPRPGLSSGHIPHSLPAPFLDYLLPASENKPYTSLRPLPELKEVLAKAVGGQEAWDELAKGQRDVVFTCGSGMSAAIGWLVNEMIRMEEGTKMKSSIYDESWTGYASRPESKIVKGDKP